MICPNCEGNDCIGDDEPYLFIMHGRNPYPPGSLVPHDFPLSYQRVQLFAHLCLTCGIIFCDESSLQRCRGARIEVQKRMNDFYEAHPPPDFSKLFSKETE